MPPWKAVASDFAYKGDRRLSEAEIDTIKRWVDAGMPEGDPAKLPAMPKFTPGWQLGPPDLVVTMSEAFEVPGGRPGRVSQFRRAVESDRRQVGARGRFPAVGAERRASQPVFPRRHRHGARGMMRAIRSRDFPARWADSRARAAVGAACCRAGISPAARRPSSAMTDESRAVGTLGGWALGANAKALPDGLAFFVPKGADLVLSTHFHPSGKAEKEASTVGLVFRDQAADPGVRRPRAAAALRRVRGHRHPAGQKEYTIQDSFVLPVDVKAFNVGAHAHYLAKQMKLTATLPDGATKTLLRIDDWDFAWQDQYRSRISSRCPRARGSTGGSPTTTRPRIHEIPSNPPKRVTWGEQSTDEMGSVGLLVVAAREDEMPTLQQVYAQHVRQAAMTRPGLRRLMMSMPQETASERRKTGN